MSLRNTTTERNRNVYEEQCSHSKGDHSHVFWNQKQNHLILNMKSNWFCILPFRTIYIYIYDQRVQTIILFV
jgi:hypothetical protein